MSSPHQGSLTPSTNPGGSSSDPCGWPKIIGQYMYSVPTVYGARVARFQKTRKNLTPVGHMQTCLDGAQPSCSIKAKFGFRERCRLGSPESPGQLFNGKSITAG
ncbi:hypothetical protein AOL_s00006g204 [Orbilia oligospora ATCC 24927]|uniref:Uncharacterized protein n=1 Tax=Arthrobotrys oligospora (strain ATCC 24927 / CBS 115.81 / DSM 1491) TaxID=756982 RepID=G1X003_ARTOA|nr:hypothetical protein AOL_s00006g204 [Orbilia oligospora ATCC 24927]EGX53338.1 hypothetical protein AOL_s00006g204 [Orbilia oligospora ATCC 24927]